MGVSVFRDGSVGAPVSIIIAKIQWVQKTFVNLLCYDVMKSDIKEVQFFLCTKIFAQVYIKAIVHTFRHHLPQA